MKRHRVLVTSRLLSSSFLCLLSFFLYSTAEESCACVHRVSVNAHSLMQPPAMTIFCLLRPCSFHSYLIMSCLCLGIHRFHFVTKAGTESLICGMSTTVVVPLSSWQTVLINPGCACHVPQLIKLLMMETLEQVVLVTSLLLLVSWVSDLLNTHADL